MVAGSGRKSVPKHVLATHAVHGPYSQRPAGKTTRQGRICALTRDIAQRNDRTECFPPQREVAKQGAAPWYPRPANAHCIVASLHSPQSACIAARCTALHALH